jgi:Putative prokaryotic signal transducing protein
MFCPECGLDFEADLAHCPDCEVPLVAEPEEPGEAAEFFPLVEVTDVDDFALVTSRLEEEGIPWFVQSESSLERMSPEGAVVIYVAEKRLPQARRAVEAMSLIVADHRL